MSEAETIRALIVDDEPMSRRMIRQLLTSIPGVEVVGESFGRQAVAEIEKLQPDVVFLDVQMPQMDGFEVLRAVQTRPLPLVIFVTAYDEHAVRAFELRALDYLLKPFTDRRLFQALTRVRETLRNRETEVSQRRLLRLLADRLDRRDSTAPVSIAVTPATGPGPANRLVAREGGRTMFIAMDDIRWIESEGAYARIHTDGDTILVRSSLNTLEGQLDPSRFFRIHRSAIVNLLWVSEVRHLSHGDYTVLLRDSTELKLSRTRREEFEAWMGMR